MSGIGCFPGKAQQALFQNGGSVLQWKPVQPVRYGDSPGSDDLPYSSSSEDDLTPQKPARFTPADEGGPRKNVPEDNANDSITSSQQTTETTGTFESSDTTGTSRLQGLPSMGPQRGLQVEEERRQLAAVKEESAEGFEGSPLFAGLPVGSSPSSSVVLKKAALPEPSPVVWELQEYGDKRRQQLKKEAWQLKRYEHLLNLLKEGLIDQADFQAHKKPIMKYMSDTCSEPGRENKELEHDKLVFLKQLKEADCLTGSEYRSAKAPILRRLAGYRIVSPSRDKGKAKGGFRAILNKLKVHGLRHHSPPRSGMSTPAGSPPRGAKWKSASNPYFTHSDPIPGGPFPPPTFARRMSSTAPYTLGTNPLAEDSQAKKQGGSGGGEGSQTPSQDLSSSPPSSIRSPLDWPRTAGDRRGPDWTPKMGPVQGEKVAQAHKPLSAAGLGSEADSKDRGAFGSEFQVQGDGFGSRLDAPGRIPGSVSLDAGSSSRGTSNRTSSGFASEFSGSLSVNGHQLSHAGKEAVGKKRGGHGELGEGKTGLSESNGGRQGGKGANYPSKFLLALHSSGEFGGFTNPFSQPPLSEDFLDSPLGTEKEICSDLESSPEESAGVALPSHQGANQGLPGCGAHMPAERSGTTEAKRDSRGKPDNPLREEVSTEFVAEERPQGKDDSGRGVPRVNLFGERGTSTVSARQERESRSSAAADAFGTDVFCAKPLVKPGPPKKLQSVLSFPPSSGKPAGRPPSGPRSRPNSPPARAAPPVPRSQTLPSNVQSQDFKEGVKAPAGLFMGSAADPRQVIPVAPSLAAKKPIPEVKVTTRINVAKIAITRQASKGPAAKQATVWNRLTGQNQGKPKKRAVGGRGEAAALLDSESEVSSEDELGNPSGAQPSRAPQVASEALTGRIPSALAQVRSQGEATRHAAPPGRTKRGSDDRKQHNAAPPARQWGAKPQRAGALHAVPESPDRAAKDDLGSEKGQGGVEDSERMEETASEASDEVLFEDVARDEEVSSRKGAEKRTAELQRGAPEGKSETAEPRGLSEKVGRDGHQRRPSQDMDVLASVFDPEEPAPAHARAEPTEKAPQEHVPPAVAPKAATAAGQPEALRHRRQPSLETVPGDEKAGGTAGAGAQEASAAKAALLRYPDGRAGQHERKKSRDLEKEEAAVESAAVPSTGVRYPEEHAARHARKKSRDMEKLAAEASLGSQAKGEGAAAEKDRVKQDGPQAETAQAKGLRAVTAKADEVKPARSTRQPEERAGTEAPQVPAAPAVLPAAPPALPAAAPQAPASGAGSKLADLKARMASMRGGGPKPAAKPVQAAPSATAAAVKPSEASAPRPSEVVVTKAPALTATTTSETPSPAIEAKAVVVAVASPVVKEEAKPGPAPSAKMDVAARVAARMAARAQVTKAASAAPPSVTPPAASTDATSREAQLEATPENTKAAPAGTAEGTVSKRDNRSLSVPKRPTERTNSVAEGDVDAGEGSRLNRARNFSGPISFSGPLRRDDVEGGREAGRRTGHATAPSSPREADSGGPFQQSRSQPGSPTRSDKLLALRRQVTTMSSAVKPAAAEAKPAALTTTTKAWPGIKRGKDGPAKSTTPGADSAAGSDTSKDDALAFSENIKNTLGRLRMEKSQQKTPGAHATRAPQAVKASAPVSRGIEGALHETSRNTPASTWARVSKLKDPKAADAARALRVSGANWEEEMQAAMQGKYAENISPEKSASMDTAGGVRDSLRNWR
ncbi:hypothetical protein KFL_002090100 [Klebsormidium nitens]|uniref:Uncharacterized protein n=1 Tax=Klebsormidium nitens TaxID=105231 RepID=A0A1Y1I9U1_KLENI|nr:hypothetical protein KFL_002090100 [Klebsormidium nitens]|eukprot:GAQ84858.1 hypothetical protein KFL_002090100 [Klebsormidium nitens]